MIDLHIHTNFSDGQYSPTEIIQMASENGVSVVAITDHDTVSGIPEAKMAAKKFNVTLVPGIEIDIEFPNREFHLLGLALKKTSPRLQKIIETLQENRKKRNTEIVEKMRADGIKVTLEEIESEFPFRTLGRPHFAAWLEKHGVVRKRQIAFDKYLSRGKPWFVERIGADLDESIEAIYESGGVPVLAHPFSLYLTFSKLEPFLVDLKNRGIVGIEAFHPGTKLNKCLRLEEMARKLGFFITAGSDFHGEKIRADRKIGRTSGNRKIDDKYYYEELMKWQKGNSIIFKKRQ